MDRAIVHLDLDSFYVSVERLLDSSLEGLPVVVGGSSSRGVVSSCSYEARKLGVHSGMPTMMAKRLCPNATFVRGDMTQYSKYSHMVTAIIADSAPLYEKASIDEFYLDVTGMERFFGTLQWVKELRQRIIRETGLPISFGLSVNKVVAKIVTGEFKPNGEGFVSKEKVQDFLDPLSIRKIPMLGKYAAQKLTDMGVSDIRSLRQMPQDILNAALGKQGLMLWKRARGIDNSPVFPYHERKSVSTERTFSKDLWDVQVLKEILVGMVERIGFDLRKKNKLCSVVTVKIKYSNFEVHSQQKQVSYTSFDHAIIEVAQELLDKAYNRKMGLRLVGVRLSGLVTGVQQLDIFEQTEEMTNLYDAMDAIKKRYGSKSLRRGINY